MIFYGDYHTHTFYSHGKGSVEDNVRAAAERGLKQVAITDHGFGHMAFGVPRRRFDSLQANVLACRADYSKKLDVLFGIEANIRGKNGQIDLRNTDFKEFDILLVGYHQMVWTTAKNFFSFSVPVQTCGLFRHTSDRRRKKNTEALIAAMERHPVDIFVHPEHILETDFVTLARAAAEHGVYLELNGKKNPIRDADLEKALAETSVKFIVNSDAHSPDRVGDFELPLSVIERHQIPAERIANAGDNAPVFKSWPKKEKTYPKLNIF
ncbi:MAG: PHP domain-containing protein [Firmicutes bacterium]|nr:PHP domain-containing protein [Bacillota bacterium]